MEFMSHLSGQDQADKPSLFELIAQDQMRDLLRPALRYLLTVYTERYPRYLLRVHHYFDELYTLLSFLVERHYLLQWRGSFSENFYGLKRVPLNGWTSKHVYQSLGFLVGLPYVKVKLDQLFERIRGNITEELFDDEETPVETPMTLRERCKHVFRVIYPWINAIYYGLILAYHIAYLYDYSKYYTPWLHLQGIELRRLSIQDIRKYYQRQEEAKERYEKVLKQGPFQRIVRYWLAMQLAKGLDWFKILLPMGMFFFKFLEWWYASDYHQRTLVRPIPPPPTPIQPHPDGLPLPKDHRLCPICLKLRTNPAALPTGYAYCYPCIFHYVEEHKQCPITLTQVTLEQIRKLYTSGV